MKYISILFLFLLSLSLVSATTISNDNSTFTGNATFLQDIYWSGNAYGFIDWVWIQNAPVYNTTQVYNKTEVDNLIANISVSTNVTGNESVFDGWDKNASDDFDGLFTSLNFSGTTGFTDGEDDDTQLTELQVDNYVSNNGYLTSETDSIAIALLSNYYNMTQVDSLVNNATINVTGSESVFDNWDKNASDDVVNFTDLQNIPTGLSDGDNDTTYSNLSEFVNDVGYLTSLIGNESVFDNWDKNYSDDFDGLFSSLNFTGTTGLSDGVDNDTTYTNLSEFTNDVGFLTAETDPVWTAVAGNYYNKTEIDNFGFSTFDGLYTSLNFTGTTGLSDGVDNDTTYSNLSEFNDDVGFLTAETDPVYSASPSANILQLNITDWNTAYSWGDHALAGYLTSGDYYNKSEVYNKTEIDNFGFSTFDGLFTSLNFIGTTGLSDGVDNDTTYSNLSEFNDDVGFLTAETDPVYSASPSANILQLNITDWNTAYSWGDHALAGYLTSGDYYNKSEVYNKTEIDNFGFSTFDGLFTSLNFTGTTGFDDLVDNNTQLTETQVDNYVANNGYLDSTGNETIGGNLTISDTLYVNGARIDVGTGKNGKTCTFIYSPDESSHIEVCNQ